MDWTQRYQYNFPTPIRFGPGVSDELAEHLFSRGKRHVLFVSDPFIVELEAFKKILQLCSQRGIATSVFSAIDRNPVKRNVLEGVAAYQQQHCDCIVGFGGGASMDVARAIALGAHHLADHDLFDFDDALGGDQYVTREIPYFITIPTTSGTGSEVGRSTIISEDDSHRKRILFSPRLMAAQVFADPLLTMELPHQVTAATGMDALTHNLEAYVAQGFSPLCDGIALEAIRLVHQSLTACCENPSLESRSKMMMAALMGATAFQKGLGIVHSLAHPLSTLYDTHHGLANAVMLSFGLQFNAECCEEKYAFIARVLGLEATAAALIDWVRDLNTRLGLANSLQGIATTADITALADLAFADPCHSCNPRSVSKAQFAELYSQALAASS